MCEREREKREREREREREAGRGGAERKREMREHLGLVGVGGEVLDLDPRGAVDGEQRALARGPEKHGRAEHVAIFRAGREAPPAHLLAFLVLAPDIGRHPSPDRPHVSERRGRSTERRVRC
eukprot:COSAG01_NODE_36502_length_516_cov_64.544365_1_plen_121_part_10